MAFMRSLLALCAVSVVQASPLQHQAPSPLPTPPSQDPWYIAPAGYESTAAGTVLRIRHAPGNLTAVLVKNVSAVYNILYRTTVSFDKPSPSYALDSLYPAAYNDILPALARGWFVNIPDFEGPLAAFTVSVEEAHATLDSVRASLACRKGLNQSNTRSALWGYSGGSLPSELAAEMHPLYAPEITLSGTAIGGLLPNIIHALETVTGHYYAGLAPLALLGLASRYPEVADYLDRALKSSGPYNRSTFLATKTQTTNEVFPTFENQTIADYFVHGEAYLRAPELKAAVHRNWLMGAYSTPTTPLFVYKAVHDEISPVADTDALVDRYCAAGANILYQRNTVGGHTAEDVNGDAAAFA